MLCSLYNQLNTSNKKLTSENMPNKKTTKGRQRIDMTKIKNKAQLQVTFSKRCAGLFKKANELCTLCGVQIAIIVFSPSGKPFSFGHPSVESIVNKFSSPNSSSTAIESSSFVELNQELQWLMEQQETEKIKSETLDILRKNGQKQLWWEADVDQLGLVELQQLYIAIEELKKNVESTQVKLMSSDPFQFTVNNSWGEFSSSDGTAYSPDASDDVFIHPVANYQIPTESFELGFCC